MPDSEDFICFLQKKSKARHRWLVPVILATQEAEIRMIAVRSQPHANSLRDYLKKNPSQKRQE
jgi:hypothetical protein